MMGLNSGGSYLIQYNGDTGGNYISHAISGNGGSTAAWANISGGGVFSNYIAGFGDQATTTLPMVCIVDIIDYTSTSKFKTLRSFAGVDKNTAGSGAVNLTSGAWRSTSAVTSITVFTNGGAFQSGTSIALYGIK
jgi:hypothetical protein